MRTILLHQGATEKIHLQVSIKPFSLNRYQRDNYYDKRWNLTPTNVIFTKRLHWHPAFFRTVPNYQMSWS